MVLRYFCRGDVVRGRLWRLVIEKRFYGRIGVRRFVEIEEVAC
jgi:hypothetical protein